MMKKTLVFFSFLCTLLLAQSFPLAANETFNPSEEYCCGETKELPCGTCYCLYCKYEPCYYNSYRCVSEPRRCTKKCYRWVPKYYEKCCVKYVPQYYTQTCCKYEQECYDMETIEYSNRRICEKHCKLVPKYYWKCTPAPAVCQDSCE